MTHAELCSIAVRWLRRPWSAGGHGCQVAMSECKAASSGEVPDAIGFRAGWNGGSFVVECKTSRADFLADRAKPHRADRLGMGVWRYFLAPTGLLRVDELPAKWGLLEVNHRGHLKALAGPAIACRGGIGGYEELLDAFRNEADVGREQALLVLALARLGDPEALNLRIREATNSVQRLIRQNEQLRRDANALRSKLWTKDCGASA